MVIRRRLSHSRLRGHHPITVNEPASYPRSEVSGLILAGGAGRRAGGRDKGLLPWQGAPLVAHVARVLEPQVASLSISCNRNLDAYREFVSSVVTDTRPDYCGPLAGLEAARAVIDTKYVLVAPCDMPRLPADLAQRLFAPFRVSNHGLDVSYAHDGRRAHYLCAMLRSTCLETLGSFLDGGGRAVYSWLEGQRTAVVDFADATEGFENINRPP